MSNRWRQAFTELTNFITKHPEVGIGATVVRIPENIRPEFYRLFNIVRVAFIEEKFSDLLDEARLLSETYAKTEQSVTELLSLDGISIASGLRRFLHNPADALTRELFDPLFDLLKGKVDIKTFEESASRKSDTTFINSYRLGYEKWVVLSLVVLFDPDKSSQVIPLEAGINFSQEQGKARFPLEGPVPSLQESNRLSFEHRAAYTTFIVPDFIVHSARLDRYVAVRTGLKKATWTASNASQQRQWYPLSSTMALESRLILIYMADNPEEICLVADAERVCRPDLIIICKDQKDQLEKEGLERLKLQHEILRPRLGTYVVSREQMPEQEIETQRADIHILTVGFNQSKLEPIMSIMINQKDGVR